MDVTGDPGPLGQRRRLCLGLESPPRLGQHLLGLLSADKVSRRVRPRSTAGEREREAQQRSGRSPGEQAAIRNTATVPAMMAGAASVFGRTPALKPRAAKATAGLFDDSPASTPPTAPIAAGCAGSFAVEPRRACGDDVQRGGRTGAASGTTMAGRLRGPRCSGRRTGRGDVDDLAATRPAAGWGRSDPGRVRHTNSPVAAFLAGRELDTVSTSDRFGPASRRCGQVHQVVEGDPIRSRPARGTWSPLGLETRSGRGPNGSHPVPLLADMADGRSTTPAEVPG